jgi:plasmid stabilization system protein ParE
MIYKIRIVKPAQTEIRETYRYIAEDLRNPTAAARRILLIDDAIQSLKENPARFPLVRNDYLATKGYRMLVVKTHLVFFVIRKSERTVSIMRVLYGRRDWLRMLKVDTEQLSDER